MFNIDDYEVVKDKSFELLPAGVYEVICVKAELKPTMDGSRRFWNFTFEPNVEVTHPYSGRYIFGSSTFEDSVHPEWEKRGRAQLADICFAAGLPKSFDIDTLSDLLEGKQLAIRTYHRKDKVTGDVKVQIGGYYTTEGVNRGGERCAERDAWITSVDPSAQAEKALPKVKPIPAVLKSTNPQPAKPISTSKPLEDDVPF